MARGTIRKVTTPERGDARWEARLSGRDRDRQRRQFRRRFATRKAAEAWLSATETSVVVDGISVSPEMTVAQYGALLPAILTFLLQLVVVIPFRRFCHNTQYCPIFIHPGVENRVHHRHASRVPVNHPVNLANLLC